MRRLALDLIQVFERLQSSQRRLFVSHDLHRESINCLERTQQVLEASRQLIERSDAFVLRIQPLAPAAGRRNSAITETSMPPH
jgi:hypothetical protein